MLQACCRVVSTSQHPTHHQTAASASGINPSSPSAAKAVVLGGRTPTTHMRSPTRYSSCTCGSIMHSLSSPAPAHASLIGCLAGLRGLTTAVVPTLRHPSLLSSMHAHVCMRHLSAPSSNLHTHRKYSFYDEKLRKLRKELRHTYESLLFLDAAFAAANDVEGQLWRSVFYMPIEEFRGRIRKAEKEAQQQQQQGMMGAGGQGVSSIGGGCSWVLNTVRGCRLGGKSRCMKSGNNMAFGLLVATRQQLCFASCLLSPFLSPCTHTSFCCVFTFNTAT